jgi:hypothetical protein
MMEHDEKPNETLVREISQPLANAASWMKFIGIMSIAYGVLMIFSIIGIIFAWLPIWLGVLLLRSAKGAQRAYASGMDGPIKESLRNLNSYFTINGVLIVIAITLSLFAFAFILFFKTLAESLLELLPV